MCIHVWQANLLAGITFACILFADLERLKKGCQGDGCVRLAVWLGTGVDGCHCVAYRP